MELLALALFLSNTANFRTSRTSRLEVHTYKVWTILYLQMYRSLGGNPIRRQVTDGFTPFLIDITIEYEENTYRQKIHKTINITNNINYINYETD